MYFSMKHLLVFALRVLCCCSYLHQHADHHTSYILTQLNLAIHPYKSPSTETLGFTPISMSNPQNLQTQHTQMFPKLFNPASGVGIAKSAIPPHPDHQQPRRNVKATITNNGTNSCFSYLRCVSESPRRGAECRRMQCRLCAGDGE